MRVLIVADNASMAFGGEAVLPLHYFRRLRARGVPAWLVVHERTREELLSLIPEEREQLTFVRDTLLHRLLWRVGRMLPRRLSQGTTAFLSRMLTQFLARSTIRTLISEQAIDVVHQPTPVSPREPSLLFGLSVPVVMGPMNGGMTYAPAAERLEHPIVGTLVGVLTWLSDGLNALIPGKRRADVLLVANERTRGALPRGCHGSVELLVENGVDLGVWDPPSHGPLRPKDHARLVFLGRLVDWKAVDALLEALRGLPDDLAIELEIIGDGPYRSAWEELAESLGLSGAVQFSGWLPQADAAERLAQADALVLPSLFEAGGAVVLEAMAMGVPVIATAWGGPTDYLDSSCGILVPAPSRAEFVWGLAEAIERLARDPALRESLGRAGRDRVIAEYDWERKVDRILQIYEEAIGNRQIGASRRSTRLPGGA